MNTLVHVPTSRAKPLLAAQSLAQRNHLQAARQRPSALLVCRAAEQDAPTATEDPTAVPAGCSRYTVELSRPLGLVLEEKGDQIVVGEVVPNGLAFREGTVAEGDILISTSGITYTRESDYGGAKVKSGEKRVTLNVRGESFDTVMAAIGTHKAGQAVELTFQRC